MTQSVSVFISDPFHFVAGRLRWMHPFLQDIDLVLLTSSSFQDKAEFSPRGCTTHLLFVGLDHLEEPPVFSVTE
jgi:hypothetical protein